MGEVFGDIRWQDGRAMIFNDSDSKNKTTLRALCAFA